MISKNFLNCVISFLSRLERRSAIIDSDGSFIWSNDSESLQNDSVKEKINNLIPTETEKALILHIDGRPSMFALTPYFRSKKIIGCYLLIKTSEASSRLDEEFNNTLTNTLSCMKSEISNIISINALMSVPLKNGVVDNEQMLSYLDRQSAFTDRALMIYTNAKIFSDICLDKEYPPQVLKLTSLVGDVCDEIKKSLESVPRKVNVYLTDEAAMARINSRLFTLAFVNAFHNAMLYSPKNSEIDIKVKVEDNFCWVSIENETGSFDECATYFDRVGMGRKIMKRIIEANYKGQCVFEDGDEKSVTVFKIPLVSEEKAESKFSSSTTSYLSERFKPVQLFVNDAIRRESEK